MSVVMDIDNPDGSRETHGRVPSGTTLAEPQVWPVHRDTAAVTS
jgi:hypothetical protein